MRKPKPLLTFRSDERQQRLTSKAGLGGLGQSQTFDFRKKTCRKRNQSYDIRNVDSTSFKSDQLSAGHPLGRLPTEDLDLIAALVLRSGSLKALAEAYGVSYPTIRSRLDRVIERLEGVMAGRAPDEMTELLASLVEQGQLSPGAARKIRETHRQAVNQQP